MVLGNRPLLPSTLSVAAHARPYRRREVLKLHLWLLVLDVGGGKIMGVSKTNGGAEGGACGLCDRTVWRLTRHHLIPKTRHKNKRNKKTFDRREIHRTVGLCSPCHRHIHTVLDNKELEREYNTLEALRAHPDVEKFVEWVSKKPHGTVADAELTSA
jgi:hypothetical protein